MTKQPTILEKYKDDRLDLIASEYFPVSNYSSIQDVENHLDQYLSEEVINKFNK